MSQRLLLQFRLLPFSISPHTAKGRLKHLCAFLVPSLRLINYVLPQRGHREAQRFLELGLRPKPQTPNAIHSPTRAYLWYHTGMQSQRDRFSGMSDEQIAAALAQERRTATDKIPIEELVTTVRQTAYALHLYLGTGYLEKVYENALKHRLEKKGIFVEAQVPLAVVDEDGFIIGRYEADLIVGNRLIIELKHCDKLAPVHVAQRINYLCTTGIEHGLLINFGSPKFEIVKRIYTKKQPQGETLP